MVSNAGGINPEACAAALRQAAKKAGVELKVTHSLEMPYLTLLGGLCIMMADELMIL